MEINTNLLDLAILGSIWATDIAMAKKRRTRIAAALMLGLCEIFFLRENRTENSRQISQPLYRKRKSYYILIRHGMLWSSKAILLNVMASHDIGTFAGGTVSVARKFQGSLTGLGSAASAVGLDTSIYYRKCPFETWSACSRCFQTFLAWREPRFFMAGCGGGGGGAKIKYRGSPLPGNFPYLSTLPRRRVFFLQNSPRYA